MTLPQSLLGQLNGNKLFSIIEDQEFGNFICKPARKTRVYPNLERGRGSLFCGRSSI